MTGTHHDVAVHAGFFQDLRKHIVVAEAVHIVADLCGHAERFLEVTLGIQGLTCERFAGGKVAVGLNVPAADNDEASFLHTLLHFLKHIGSEFFHPLINGGGGTDEPEFRELVHTVECGTDGCLCFRTAFLPAPLPYGVEVRIADEVILGFLFHIKCSFRRE